MARTLSATALGPLVEITVGFAAIVGTSIWKRMASKKVQVQIKSTHPALFSRWEGQGRAFNIESVTKDSLSKS